MTVKEKQFFPKMLAEGLLSQGPLSGIKPMLKIPFNIGPPHSEKITYKVVILGEDIHHFGLRMLNTSSYKRCSGCRVIFEDIKEKQCRHCGRESGIYYMMIDGVEIESVVLWRLLKGYCERLYSKALAEALSKSREKEKRDYSASFFDWKAGEKE